VGLLERDDILQLLDGLLVAAGEGKGRAVLVRGEAGIGKTSTVRAFRDSHTDDAHVLWGGCDDLLTARPLGPVWDMALDEPLLAEALRGQDRYEVFAAVLDLMTRGLRPTIVVIEDIHWADEATLDLVKFLGRRIDRTHGLLVLTYRDGQVPGDRPLRVALADVGGTALERITLEPLSPEAVTQMASEASSSVRKNGLPSETSHSPSDEPPASDAIWVTASGDRGSSVILSNAVPPTSASATLSGRSPGTCPSR
jgi:predicted ATPase